jgi:2-phosphoglycerate kinase
MGSSGSSSRSSDQIPPKRIVVEDEAGRRPFMRGIMVHSLMSRGVSFDDAYGVANAVRDKIRGRGVVSRKDLVRAVHELLGAPEAYEDRAGVDLPMPILVMGKRSGKGAQFSKGLFSQSLLAAAIEPSDAFDVAREVEGELMGRGVSEVDTAELRCLAYETLYRRAGERAAERYLAWRRCQAGEKPMILLLGGATGVGKTSLAHEVAHRLRIQRVVSTDAIRQVMRTMLSAELVPAIHASSYEAHRVVTEIAAGDDPVVGAFRAQATTVSVGVRAMMDRAVAENTSMILEGVSVAPGLIDLEPYGERTQVIFLLVASLDEDAFATRFASRAKDAVGRPPHRYIENVDSILKIQDHLLELAEAGGVPIVDNSSFDASVISIIGHVTETLRKQGELDAADRS